MKKLTLTLILLLALFTVNFADDGGHTGGDGKNCPNGQTTCRVLPADDDPITKIFKELISIFF